MSQWQSCDQSFGAFTPGAAKIPPLQPTSLPILNQEKSDFDIFYYILHGKCCTWSEVDANLCECAVVLCVCEVWRPLRQDFPLILNLMLFCCLPWLRWATGSSPKQLPWRLLLMYHCAVNDRKNSTFQHNSSLAKWFPSMIHALSCA